MLMGVVAAVFGVSFGATNLLLGGLVLGAAGVVVAADTDGDPGSA